MVTPTQHPTELTVCESSPLLEKTKCTHATSAPRPPRSLDLSSKNLFANFRAKGARVALCTLVRAVASLGDGTEDARSGLGNSSLSEMPLCQQGEQGQLLFAAKVFSPRSRNSSAPCQRQPQPQPPAASLRLPVPPAPLCRSRPLDSHQLYSPAGRAGIYLLQAPESGLHFKLDSRRHFIISDKSQSMCGLPTPLAHPWPTNEPALQHINP